MTKLSTFIREELSGIHLSLLLVQLVMHLLPNYVGSRLRTYLFRMVGFDFGSGTVIWGKLQLVGDAPLPNRLSVGKECWINTGCYFELVEKVTIGNRVSIGQEVMILTNTHKVGASQRRAGVLSAKSVTVGDGAWLSTRCTILPGVEIGAGSIVAAGAMVTKSVPPNVMVAGIPARILQELPADLDTEAKEEMAAVVTPNVPVASAEVVHG